MNRPKSEDYETKIMLDDQELKIKVDLSNFGYLKDLENIPNLFYYLFVEPNPPTLSPSAESSSTI